MLNMVDKNQILIKFYREGKSKSFISQELKISRKTVRRYIAEHEQKNNSCTPANHLETGLSTKPAYNSSGRNKRVLTQEICNEIVLCLERNIERINSGMRKQVMKNIDIHNHLSELGHTIGYTTVCSYIKDYTNAKKECFIKQVYLPGSTCEFDWGELKLNINGNVQKYYLAVFTSANSNYRYAKLFNRQDSLAFAQSHIDFFSYTGGVFKEMVYDNMRVAVKTFVGRTEKEATQGLLELSNYYKFGFRFCNIRKGNEKGHVERSVEYIRRKSFSSKVDFETLEQANLHLLNTCNKLNETPQKLQLSKSAKELFELEKPHLFVSNTPYISFENEHAKVDKYSTISCKTNRYSVPDFLVGKLLDLRIFAEKIDIYFNSERVCSHKRSYGLHTWTMDINHFLTTLYRKPGALKSSLTFLQMNDYLQKLRADFFNDSTKDFIELLIYFKDKQIDFERVKKSVEQVISITPTNVNKDKILAILHRQMPANSEDIIQNQQDKPASQTEQYAMQDIKTISSLLTNK